MLPLAWNQRGGAGVRAGEKGCAERSHAHQHTTPRGISKPPGANRASMLAALDLERRASAKSEAAEHGSG